LTVVFIDAVNKLYIDAVELPEDQLVDRLRAKLEDKAEKTVYLKGDKNASYGAIMKMMDALRKAQIDTVGLITERPGGSVKEGGN